MSQLDQILARGRSEHKALSRLFLAFGLVVVVMLSVAITNVRLIQELVRDYRLYRDTSQLQTAIDQVRVTEMILMREQGEYELSQLQRELAEFNSVIDKIMPSNPELERYQPLLNGYIDKVQQLIELVPSYAENNETARNQYALIKANVLALAYRTLQEAQVSPSHSEALRQLQHQLTQLISAMGTSPGRNAKIDVDTKISQITLVRLELYLEQINNSISELNKLQSRMRGTGTSADLKLVVDLLEQFGQHLGYFGKQKALYEELTVEVINSAQALSDTISNDLKSQRQLLMNSSRIVDLLLGLAFTFTLITVILIVALVRSRRASDHVLQGLVVAVRSAEAAADAKARFLATMSHEVRTPMNAIIGLSQLALREPMSDKVAGWIRQVNTSAEGLLHVLNDILDVSKVEAGKLVIEQRPFDLHQLLEQLDATFAFSAREKGLDWQLVVHPNVPAMIEGDALRVAQILQNLISNALKFTIEGGITLSVEKQSNAAQQLICFSVSDTGVGIAQEHVSNLFQPFEQGDPATSRHFGGTGLGLAISHGLAKAMKAHINVASTLGDGSCFSLCLPYISANERQLHNEHFPAVNQQRLLWNACNSAKPSNWSTWLAAHNLSTKFVDDAQQATVTVISADQVGTQPDAPTLVLHSSWSNQGREGNQMHLNLPLSSKRLANAIEQLLCTTECDCHSINAQSPKLALPAGKRVLLVEDNLVNQELMVGLLEPLQWHLDVCHNGLQAVEQVKQHHYDLVLMDCMMPVMDGFEATQQIKSQGHCNAPIIALSAFVLPEEKQRMRDCGFDDSIDKPVQQHQLQQVLSRWLEPAVTLVDAKPSDGLPEIPGIDRHSALQSAGGNVDIVRRALLLFAEQLQRFSNQQLADQDSAKRAVHSLKGVAGNLGAKSLYWLCHQTESQMQPDHLTTLQKQAATLAQTIRNSITVASADTSADANQCSKAELIAAVRNGDFNAVELLKGHNSTSLAISPQQFAQLESALQQLDFTAALTALSEHGNA